MNKAIKSLLHNEDEEVLDRVLGAAESTYDVQDKAKSVQSKFELGKKKRTIMTDKIQEAAKQAQESLEQAAQRIDDLEKENGDLQTKVASFEKERQVRILVAKMVDSDMIDNESIETKVAELMDQEQDDINITEKFVDMYRGNASPESFAKVASAFDGSGEGATTEERQKIREGKFFAEWGY